MIKCLDKIVKTVNTFILVFSIFKSNTNEENRAVSGVEKVKMATVLQMKIYLERPRSRCSVQTFKMATG